MRSMTIGEISAWVDAAQERRLDDFKQLITAAHLAGALVRIPANEKGNKAFPSLESILRKLDGGKRNERTPMQRREDVIAFFNAHLPPDQKVLYVKDGKVKVNP